MIHFGKTCARGLALGFALILSMPVSAGTCGYDYCFGAISAGDGGMTARSTGRRTAPDALARVEKICGTRCGVI